MSNTFKVVLIGLGVWFTCWAITEGLYGETNMWQAAAGFLRPALFLAAVLIGWGTYRAARALWRRARRISFKTTRDA